MAKVGFRRNIRIGRVVSKLVLTVLSLYVGGVIMDVLGDVMNGTTSPFNKGLSLIGWTVSTTGQITSTDNSAGILAVVGLVGIASVVMEFVEFHF